MTTDPIAILLRDLWHHGKPSEEWLRAWQKMGRAPEIQAMFDGTSTEATQFQYPKPSTELVAEAEAQRKSEKGEGR